MERINKDEQGSLISVQQYFRGLTGTEFNPTLNYLIDSLISYQFEYTNLPTEGGQINERRIEDFISTGQAVFFEIGGYYFIQPAVNFGEIDTQGDFFQHVPIGLNGVSFEPVITKSTAIFKGDNLEVYDQNAVLIRNNNNSLSTISILAPLIERINYIWQSIGDDIALSRAKLLFHAATGNTKNVQMKELDRLFNGRKPYAVITDKDFLKEAETFKTEVNVNDLGILWDSFDKCFMLLLTVLGVNNTAQPDKSERLLVDEVNINNELIYLVRENAYQNRKKAIDEINKLFGLNIEVKPRYESITQPQEQKQQDTEEGTKEEEENTKNDEFAYSV